MKYVKRGVYAFAFCFILLAGFLMPKAVFHLQDLQLEVEVDSYGLNNTSLRQSSHLLERMQAIREDMVELTQTEQTSLDVANMYPLMVEAADVVGLFKIVDDTVMEWDAVPKQMISRDGTLSFIVWDCYINMEYGDIFMSIDDATGKLLSMREYIYGDWVPGENEIDSMEDRLKDYYACDYIEQLVDENYIDLKDVNGSVVDSNRSETTDYDMLLLNIRYNMIDGEFQTEVNVQFEENFDTSYLLLNAAY